MNRVVIIGKISRDANLEYTPAGTAVCTLSIETEESFINKDKQQKTRKEWIRAVSFGKAAELHRRDLIIGSEVYVHGKLMTRKTQIETSTKYITEVWIDHLEILDNISASGSSQKSTESQNYTVDDVKWDDDEVPF